MMVQIATRAMNTTDGSRERTCCNCWHIKHGTIVLGLVELVGVSLLFGGTVNKIIFKNNLTVCQQNKPYFVRLFEDCLMKGFSHFDWTLGGDYLLAFLLTLTFFCIVLLFLGIVRRSPMMLVPHLIIQAIGLTFSLAYFVLYAWTYFYGDIYMRQNEFMLQSMLERMWLASLLLMLAIFEFYLFFTVIKCCLYLQALKNERLRRIRQFEECSKRVRDAKQNGLWRSTSWGGGFQEYKGQYDEDNLWNKKREKKDKPIAHVQWNLQANREQSFSYADDSLKESTRKGNNNKTMEQLTVPSRIILPKTSASADNSPNLYRANNFSSSKNTSSNTASTTITFTSQVPNSVESTNAMKNKQLPRQTLAVMKSASTSQVKLERIGHEHYAKRKNSGGPAASDMQISDQQLRSSPRSNRSAATKNDASRTYSGDSSSGTEVRRLNGDVRGNPPDVPYQRIADSATSSSVLSGHENQGNRSPHHRHHHHHHHHPRLDSANYSEQVSPSRQNAPANEQNPIRTPLKKVSVVSKYEC